MSEVDIEIAGLGNKFAEANSRADTAEFSNKTMEKKAKAARSDHDSALQKKENEVSTHKNAREKAAEDRDSARSELKAARAEAAQNKKRITKLEKQVSLTMHIIFRLRIQLQHGKSIGKESTRCESKRVDQNS